MAPNHYIAGLALTTMGNIASEQICRDVAPEIEQLSDSDDPYIRKKVLFFVLFFVDFISHEVSVGHLVRLEDRAQGARPGGALLEQAQGLPRRSRPWCAHCRRRLHCLRLQGPQGLRPPKGPILILWMVDAIGIKLTSVLCAPWNDDSILVDEASCCLAPRGHHCWLQS